MKSSARPFHSHSDRPALRVKKARTRAIKNSISKWMDRSKDFIGTLPTAKELREEFADWHSFEPLHPNEIALSGAFA